MVIWIVGVRLEHRSTLGSLCIWVHFATNKNLAPSLETDCLMVYISMHVFYFYPIAFNLHCDTITYMFEKHVRGRGKFQCSETLHTPFNPTLPRWGETTRNGINEERPWEMTCKGGASSNSKVQLCQQITAATIGDSLTGIFANVLWTWEDHTRLQNYPQTLTTLSNGELLAYGEAS